MKNLKKYPLLHKATRFMLPLALVGLCFYLLSFAFDGTFSQLASSVEQNRAISSQLGNDLASSAALLRLDESPIEGQIKRLSNDSQDPGSVFFNNVLITNMNTVNSSCPNSEGIDLNPDASWYSGDADQSYGLAWGDVDLDGDLDLVVANQGPNKIYLNHKGNLEQIASWQSNDTYESRSVAWADMDGDGDLDLAVGNFGGPNQLYRNDGLKDGILTLTILMLDENDTSRTTSIAWGDVNGDGKYDLAVGNYQNINKIYLNNGQQPMAIVWEGSDKDDTRSVAWGDVDHDGDLDLAVGNYAQANKVYWNDGLNEQTQMQMSQGWTDTQSENTTNVAWGDVDGDEWLDLAIGTEDRPDYLYLNKKGILTSDKAWTTVTTRGMAWGDVDGDGDLDLAVSNNSAKNRVFLNENGQLRSERCWLSNDIDKTYSVAWGDVDNDGDLDLAVTNELGANKLYQNEAKMLISDKSRPLKDRDLTQGVAWGDIDGDGDLDLAVANSEESNKIYLNQEGRLEATAVWSDTFSNRSTNLAWGDMDGDGYLDLAVANRCTSHTPSSVYLNQEGKLKEHDRWLSEMDDTIDVAWGDVDGDGDLDLAVGNRPGCGTQGANKLYLNEGTKLSDDPFWISEEGDKSWGIAWGDMDNDGDLDLAVANVGKENKVYQNQGGQLERSASWKSHDTDHTYDVVWGDIDLDGDLDLAVANRQSPAKVYLNHNGNLEQLASWFSNDSDYSSSLAFGDMDNDGDLDLAVGNRYAPNKIYLNQNGTLTSQAFWRSDDRKITRGIAWGDVDGDGDLDLASGNEGENQLYLSQRLTLRSPAIALSSTIAAADFYAYPKILESGIISITYTLFHPNSKLMQVRAFYSLNGGGKWLEAKAASQTAHLDTSPSGVTHTYLWDVLSSGFFGQSDNVVFRLEAQASFNLIPNTVPGPFQDSYISVQSYPFRVRGSQVRVLNASEAVGNALVYHLPAEETGGANVLGKSYEEPFRTDSEGYLQGRGKLAISDTLIALLPVSQGLESFDGQDNYVEIESNDGLQLDQQITIEAMIKPRQVRRDGHIVNRGGGWDKSGYSLFLYGGKIRVELQNADTKEKTIVDTPYSDDNQCHHVAFTWNSQLQEVKTYIDGKLQTEIGHFEGPIGLPNQKLNIGRNEQHGYYFDGLITEVRLWNVARSQEELQRDINQRLESNKAGLVGYWLLNEQAGGVTSDQSSSGNDGRGQGQLFNNQETIVNKDPCAQSHTVYYTSATPSEKGVSSYQVKQLGVQTVTVSANNPLLLFDLDVSLEWDASQDKPFMKQLEYDLRRTSELLYDWTDGQAALGELTIYHDREKWDEADIRIYATNRLRPNADIGGIVKSEMSEVITDSSGISNTISYNPGQLRMGVIWNRYGNSEGTLGEDWPRALAHELGHYLFFLNDNYLGFDEQKHLVSLEGCHSAMSDPYREDYSEFVTEAAWLPDCKNTLSHRPDWQTISNFYPLQSPSLTSTNPGPHILPLEVTQFKIIDPEGPPTTLELPIFYLTDEDGKRVIASKSARAYLFRGTEEIISLGSPVLDQVIARGASPGDRLCLYDLEAKRLGCEQITLGDEQIELKQVTEWQPDVIVSPVTSQTVELEVAGELPRDVTLEARFFGTQNHVTQTITLTPEEDYRGSFDFSEPTLAGYIHVRMVDDEQSREIVTSYGLGGAPIKLEIFGAGGWAPVISPDGQVILYGDKLNFAKGELLSLQNATTISETQLPPWVNVVGDAYRLMASENITDKILDMSITFNYLEQDVLAGEEPSLRIYYLTDTEQSEWQALTTTLDIEHNFASASIKGTGLYALMSGQPIKLKTGWNLFAYPLWTTQPITETLAPIEGKYTIVCGYDREDTQDPWKVYRVDDLAQQNDLQQLEYGQGYWIKATEPITLSLRGAEDQSRFTNTMSRQTLPDALDGCEAVQETAPTPYIIYIVQPDDTMYRIAKSHQTTVRAIIEANDLPNAYLKIGQQLIIPGRTGR